MRRPILVLLTTVTMLLAGAGWAMAGGGGHGAGVCRAYDEGPTLLMRDSCYEGVAQLVTAGQTMTVTNGGDAPHSITAADGSFDSGIIAPGDTHQLTLDEAGVVPIYCTLHGTAEGEGMAGVLVVQAADLGNAEPAASPAATSSWPWIVGAAVLGGLVATGLARRRRRGAV